MSSQDYLELARNLGIPVFLFLAGATFALRAGWLLAEGLAALVRRGKAAPRGSALRKAQREARARGEVAP